MPSPRVLDLNPNPRTELTPLEKTLSAFSERNRENQLQQQETDALKQIYAEYQQDGGNLQQTLMDIQTRPGISPTTRVNSAKQLLEFGKYNTELQKKAREDVEKAEKKNYDLQKRAADEKEKADKKANELRQTEFIEDDRKLPRGTLAPFADNPALAERLTKPPKEALEKPEKLAPLSPYEKTRQTILAKQNIEDKSQIPKIQDALKNITRMEELSKKISGVVGLGKALIGTESAAEFDALGLASIEPVLKIFNPVGAIPTQKIELLRSKWAPKATDRQSVIDGKLRALKGLNEQALVRAQERISLFDEYKGSPPEEVLNSFDNESADFIDAALDIPSDSGMPSAQANNGRKIKNNETGKVFISDGKKWNPI